MLWQAASSIFATSLASLSGSQLAAVGKDAGGSRALEAYFASQAPAKAKRRALRQLAGSWAALGASPGGSYVVQAAYVCSVSARRVKGLDTLDSKLPDLE